MNLFKPSIYANLIKNNLNSIKDQLKRLIAKISTSLAGQADEEPGRGGERVRELCGRQPGHLLGAPAPTGGRPHARPGQGHHRPPQGPGAETFDLKP